MTFDNIKELKLSIRTGDYMYNDGSVEYSIKTNDNCIIISCITGHFESIDGMPESTKTSKVVLELNPTLKSKIEEMANIFSSYSVYDNDCFYIVTQTKKYKSGVNRETIKCFYEFLLSLSLPEEFNLYRILSLYNSSVDQQKESWDICEESEEDLAYSFKFTHINKKVKILNELLVTFDYSTKFDNGIRVEGKSTVKNGDVYTVFNNKLTYSEKTDIIKKNLESFFEYYKQFNKTSISDDYCTLSYKGEKIVFERKYLNNDFFAFLNYFSSGNNVFDDEVKENIKKTLGKYKYNDYEAESNIQEPAKEIPIGHDSCVILESMYAYDNGGIESGERFFIFVFFEEYNSFFKHYYKRLLKIDINNQFYKRSITSEIYWYLDVDDEDKYKEENYYKLINDLLTSKTYKGLDKKGVVCEWCPDNNRLISMGSFKKKDLPENLFEGYIDENTYDILKKKIPNQLLIYDTKDISNKILNVIPSYCEKYYVENFMTDLFYSIDTKNSKVWDGNKMHEYFEK